MLTPPLAKATHMPHRAQFSRIVVIGILTVGSLVLATTARRKTQFSGIRAAQGGRISPYFPVPAKPNLVSSREKLAVVVSLTVG